MKRVASSVVLPKLTFFTKRRTKEREIVVSFVDLSHLPPCETTSYGIVYCSVTSSSHEMISYDVVVKRQVVVSYVVHHNLLSAKRLAVVSLVVPPLLTCKIDEIVPSKIPKEEEFGIDVLWAVRSTK
ncbi:hypothetical protein Scep_012460 [Stephania cephalantha]|uniref:Uncharacterized protein n=1 Tax=Stephania cephalantha TaxID=152367 RepID=A0AAP0JHC9_9MAGN